MYKMASSKGRIFAGYFGLWLLLWALLFMLWPNVGRSQEMQASLANPKEKEKVIVAFGDSLTAGYRLKKEDAFPAQLERALAAQGHAVRVINAGVSGDTTRGGLGRVAKIVQAEPDIVILALGANDALRGLNPQQAYENLYRILYELREQDIRVLLAGMKAPRNLGPAYTEKFDKIYPHLANEFRVTLYPFFIEEIAMKPEYNLKDGIHPNPAGVQKMVQGILPYVEHVIEQGGPIE